MYTQLFYACVLSTLYAFRIVAYTGWFFSVGQTGNPESFRWDNKKNSLKGGRGPPIPSYSTVTGKRGPQNHPYSGFFSCPIETDSGFPAWSTEKNRSVYCMLLFVSATMCLCIVRSIYSTCELYGWREWTKIRKFDDDNEMWENTIKLNIT